MNSTLPPLYALRAFEAAARYPSFSQAAVELNITPGAVSRHIRTLESWFDCQLFTRSGPKVEITVAGKRLAGQLSEGFESLENACRTFRGNNLALRLKAPSTLTMRWLLDIARLFREQNSTPVIEIASVWMDKDRVDFRSEPYDCAILLGDGNFGADNHSLLLFNEWLIPVCAPSLLDTARQQLDRCELLHPTNDRRDWRRWLKGSGKYPTLNLLQGQVFDTLEQGNMAAASGHGVSIGDLLLSLNAINNGLLALPFEQAVASGDSYYLVWPKNATKTGNINHLATFLLEQAPTLPTSGIEWHK